MSETILDSHMADMDDVLDGQQHQEACLQFTPISKLMAHRCGTCMRQEAEHQETIGMGG